MDIRSNGYQGLKWQALQSFMSNRFRSKQWHIHLSSRCAVMSQFSMYAKASSMERTKKDLNVFGSTKENNKRDSECMWKAKGKKQEILNVFRIIKGKSRNEVKKRKNRRKLGCM